MIQQNFQDYGIELDIEIMNYEIAKRDEANSNCSADNSPG
jgi:hypothetical protein